MNIERMLQEEHREKKRTGNGIFSRTGTRGHVGKMMFASDLMSRKEKREYQRSGQVVSYNMNQVLLYNEFIALPKERQRELLIHWRQKYKTKLIFKNMGIGHNLFYKLLSELDVPTETRTKRTEKRIFSPEEIETFKNDVIELGVFKQLDKSQQKEVFNFYLTQFTANELANLWGMDAGYIYNVKHRLNSTEEEAKPETKKVTPIADEQPEPKKEFSNSQYSTPEPKKEVVHTPQNNGMQIALSGDYLGTDLASKLRKLADFVESEGHYEVTVTIKEKGV